MTGPAQFDAVSLGIMWDRLVSITDEIHSALVRSSFSTIVRESGDLSVILLDAEGNSLAQGSYSVPSFTGTAAPTLGHMLAKFPPETLSPGDVIATNDAWMGTGHLYDINVMRPVFRDGRIVGYTMSITHLPDIGGPGFGASASEIYHEGIRLPICKLVRAGELDQTIIDIVRNNVRVPEQVFGDLMANVTCNEVGGRQLLEFMDEYGLDEISTLSAAVRSQAEQTIRERLAEIPDGTYENSLQIEGIDEPLTLSCRIEVNGDDITLDFAGTSPVVEKGINVLHHVGAKTDTERITPLMYQSIDGGYAVFASKAGADTNPDWLHNVKANPETKVEVGSEIVAVIARVAAGDEHDRIWSKQKQDWPQFAEYENKTARDVIPVVILETD